LDVALTIAKQADQVVEVTAGAQLIDTEGGTLHAEFDQEESK
jgi:hypothetical protein